MRDACNDCGQCDPWCPEDGGPYLVKPNLYLSAESFDAHPDRDGFVLSEDRSALTWRRGGALLTYTRLPDGRARLSSPDGELILQGDTPVASAGTGEIELWRATTMRLFLDAFNAPGIRTWLPTLSDSSTSDSSI